MRFASRVEKPLIPNLFDSPIDRWLGETSHPEQVVSGDRLISMTQYMINVLRARWEMLEVVWNRGDGVTHEGGSPPSVRRQSHLLAVSDAPSGGDISVLLAVGSRIANDHVFVSL